MGRGSSKKIQNQEHDSFAVSSIQCRTTRRNPSGGTNKEVVDVDATTSAASSILFMTPRMTSTATNVPTTTTTNNNNPTYYMVDVIESKGCIYHIYKIRLEQYGSLGIELRSTENFNPALCAIFPGVTIIQTKVSAVQTNSVAESLGIQVQDIICQLDHVTTVLPSGDKQVSNDNNNSNNCCDDNQSSNRTIHASSTGLGTVGSSSTRTASRSTGSSTTPSSSGVKEAIEEPCIFFHELLPRSLPTFATGTTTATNSMNNGVRSNQKSQYQLVSTTTSARRGGHHKQPSPAKQQQQPKQQMDDPNWGLLSLEQFQSMLKKRRPVTFYIVRHVNRRKPMNQFSHLMMGTTTVSSNNIIDPTTKSTNTLTTNKTDTNTMSSLSTTRTLFPNGIQISQETSWEIRDSCHEYNQLFITYESWDPSGKPILSNEQLKTQETLNELLIKVKKEAKQYFEEERDSILQSLPSTITDSFNAVGFSRWGRCKSEHGIQGKRLLPVHILNPFQHIGPGKTRNEWLSVYNSHKVNGNLDKMKHLIYWYGTNREDYSIIAQNKFIAYQQAIDQGLVPPAGHQINNKKCTRQEKDAYIEMNAYLHCPQDDNWNCNKAQEYYELVTQNDLFDVAKQMGVVDVPKTNMVNDTASSRPVISKKQKPPPVASESNHVRSHSRGVKRSRREQAQEQEVSVPEQVSGDQTPPVGSETNHVRSMTRSVKRSRREQGLELDVIAPQARARREIEPSLAGNEVPIQTNEPLLYTPTSTQDDRAISKPVAAITTPAAVTPISSLAQADDVAVAIPTSVDSSSIFEYVKALEASKIQSVALKHSISTMEHELAQERAINASLRDVVAQLQKELKDSKESHDRILEEVESLQRDKDKLASGRGAVLSTFAKIKDLVCSPQWNDNKK